MLLSGLFSFLSKILLFTGKIGTSRLTSFDKKLSKEKEQEYFLRLLSAKENGKTDIEAEEKLIKHNLRLVAHIAKKYKSPTQTTDDLISIGSIGLIKAVRSYNADKCKCFSPYASRCIENEILMVLRSEKKLNGEMSLSCPLGIDSDGNELYLEDILFLSPEELEKSISAKTTLTKLFYSEKAGLSGREKEILSLRFGLTPGSVPLTQKETSKKLNISRSYISRLEQCAIKKLQEFIKQENITEY